MTTPTSSAPLDDAAADANGEDDEALRWAGDDDRGQVAPRRRTPGVESDSPNQTIPDEPLPPTRPVRSLLTAIFALVYLALTVGWILAVQYTSAGTTDLLPQVLWQFGEFTAIISAALWFGATTSLTREGKTVTRIGWLALGAGVLIPWPLVLELVATGVR